MDKICFLLRESNKRAKEASDLLEKIPSNNLDEIGRDALEVAKTELQVAICSLGTVSILTTKLEERRTIPKPKSPSSNRVLNLMLWLGLEMSITT